jgi:hypothetical protein
MTATAIKNAINITNIQPCDGNVFLEVSITGYDEYETLPRVVLFQNATYKRTGWNSDRMVAYYKSDVMGLTIAYGM